MSAIKDITDQDITDFITQLTKTLKESNVSAELLEIKSFKSTLFSENVLLQGKNLDLIKINTKLNEENTKLRSEIKQQNQEFYTSQNTSLVKREKEKLL